MTIYQQLLILAAVVIYIVDVSGFTQSWRDALAHFLHLPDGDHLKPLPPFDCVKCATFWACCIFAACRGEFSLLTLAEAAGLSLLSLPISHLLRFLIEAPTALIDKLTPYE